MGELDFVIPEPPKLPIPIEFNRFCYACNAEHIFILESVCMSGHVGRCSNCGDERVVPFTRTVMEEE